MPPLRSHRSIARRTLALLALFAAPVAARAQLTGTVTYLGPATTATAFNYSVGPVNETLALPSAPGRSVAITAFCVDLANGITNNTTYAANITSLGAVLAGRATLAQTRRPGDLVGYQKAAFLIDQFQSAPVASLTGATRDQTWGAIQGALWSLFTPAAVALDASTSTTSPTVIEYWRKRADDFAASAAFATYDYGRFSIITDVRAAGVASGAGVQEFMTASAVVPEPSTVLLLGGGLVVVAGAGARRRRGSAARAGAEA